MPLTQPRMHVRVGFLREQRRGEDGDRHVHGGETLSVCVRARVWLGRCMCLSTGACACPCPPHARAATCAPVSVGVRGRETPRQRGRQRQTNRYTVCVCVCVCVLCVYVCWHMHPGVHGACAVIYAWKCARRRFWLSAWACMPIHNAGLGLCLCPIVCIQ
jgi:hypothetical protein